MTARQFVITFSSVFLLAACGQQAEEATTEDASGSAATAAAEPTTEMATKIVSVEESGLQIEIISSGHGREAVAGDNVTVHYTGWLYDETADDNRGAKFDSSVDRGDKFQFPLGAGQVIKGWDEGVAGMLIGEKRVLTIPPDMGYGERGAGDVIPPGATLVFEVELFNAEALSE